MDVIQHTARGYPGISADIFPKPHSLRNMCFATSRASICCENWISGGGFTQRAALNCDEKTAEMDQRVVVILWSHHCCVCARSRADIQQSAAAFPFSPFCESKTEKNECLETVRASRTSRSGPACWTSRCVRFCVRVPVGHLAGTRTAAASGAAGPSDAARCSQDAADGGGPHAQHPECSEPTKITRMLPRRQWKTWSFPAFARSERHKSTDRFGVIGGGRQRFRVARTQRPLEDVQQSFAILAHLKRQKVNF